MSVRIFCNSCQTFIRGAKKEEIKQLTGEEICEGCAGKMQTSIDSIEKSAARAIKQIETKRNDSKALLSRMIKKAVKGD